MFSKLAVCAGLAVIRVAAQNPADPHRTVVDQGLSVDFSISRADKPSSTVELREADPVTIRFKIADTVTGTPVLNAHPAAWMDHVSQGENRSPELCAKKFQMFLSGGLTGVPDANLNIYYVVTLNDDATLSVLDPLVGFGDSKLLAMVKLAAPAFDWALSTDQSRIFVSLPQANQVAMVDTKGWSVIASAEVAVRPTRVMLQPDQHYVWIASEASGPDASDSGVTVLTADGLRLAARIVTGRGSHDIAFDADSRFAFVTNSADNTVSVIDIRNLRKVKDLQTGASPMSIAYASKAGMVYVTGRADGAIVAIDAVRHEIVARVQAEPGVSQIRFAPDGRYAFVVNPAKNRVHIIDAAANRLIQTFMAKSRPDQVSFTDKLAYIRDQGDDTVLMIPLEQIGKPGSAVPAADFTGGKNPPGMGAESYAGDGIVQAPGENAVLVANPKDHAVYYYSEGMAAPVGNFSTYGREPKAVLVVDRSLRERSGSGVYETTGVLGKPGMYDVVFFLDTPKFIHCFPVVVSPNPEIEARRGPRFGVRFLNDDKTVRVGEKFQVRLQVVNSTSTRAPVPADDMMVQIFQTAGWRSREAARSTGEAGVYAAEFVVPRPGIYYVNLETGNPRLNNPGSLILRAVPPQVPAAHP